MTVAKEIVEKEYRQLLSGIEAERLLLKNGYVGFYARDIEFQWMLEHQLRSLTNEQIDFIIENMKYANNSEQKQSIQELLEENDAIKERNILDIVTAKTK